MFFLSRDQCQLFGYRDADGSYIVTIQVHHVHTSIGIPIEKQVFLISKLMFDTLDKPTHGINYYGVSIYDDIDYNILNFPTHQPRPNQISSE